MGAFPMKKFFALSCAVFVFASCQSFLSNGQPDFTFVVSSPYQDDLIQVSVPGLVMVNRLTTGNQVVGLNVEVHNKSDKSLTVKWGDSSIEYDNKSHMVFLNGRFYSDAGKPMPDAYIGAGRTATSGLIPADNVPSPSASAYNANHAPFEPLRSNDITCHISIKLGDETRVYVIRVVVGGQQQGPVVTPSLP